MLLYIIYSLAFILTPWPLLQIGHQLVANVEVVKIAKRETARVEEGHLAEAARLEEKIAEVIGLQEALQKEGQTSSDLRTTLEEKRKKAEAEVSELKAQISELKVWIPSLVSEAGA